MASPDLSPYVDLTLYDKGVLDLINRAVSDAAAKLPGWIPREGNTEMVLIEEQALICAELIYAVNRVPGAIVEILLQLFGITRSPGAPPTATVTFNLADAIGHELPAGTRVRLDLGAGIDPVVFTTDAAADAAVGVSTITTSVTGATNAARANGVGAPTALVMVDSVPWVNSAQLASTVANGLDPEGVSDWITRGTQMFSRLVTTLVLPAHFTAAALAQANVYRAFTVNNWDPTAGGGAGAAANGHVTTAVLDPNGALLSGPAKTAIAAALAAAAEANLAVHVVDPTITAVAVTTTVAKLATADATTVQNAVIAAVQAYLSPKNWGWGATVRRNELLSLIDDVAGVDYVVSLTAPAADVALPGVAPLANAGAVAVTVT